MGLILIISAKKNTIKKSICIRIGLFFMKIYEHFRECSGVKEASDKILNKYKEDEKKVEIIDENMPRFVSETERILNRNRYLEGRVTYMFNELIDIKQYANVGDIESILVLLSKYNLNKKLEL